MSSRRSPSSAADDIPSVPESASRETLARRLFAMVAVHYQSHPNPLRLTLSNSAIYSRNILCQSQSGYPPFFQQVDPRKWRLFTNKPIARAGARLPIEFRRRVARAAPCREIQRSSRFEAGISFRTSNMVRKVESPRSGPGAAVRLFRRRPQRTVASCNNPVNLSSLVARRIYGGNVASDVSVTGGCNFQPRRSA